MDHREKGRTYADSIGAPEWVRNRIVDRWDSGWSSHQMPTSPYTLDLHLRSVPQYKLDAVRMVKHQGFALINFVEGLFLNYMKLVYMHMFRSFIKLPFKRPSSFKQDCRAAGKDVVHSARSSAAAPPVPPPPCQPRHPAHSLQLLPHLQGDHPGQPRSDADEDPGLESQSPPGQEPAGTA